MTEDRQPATLEGIHVGASPEAIEAAHRAIAAILDSPRDEETVRTALRTFTRVAEVKYTSIIGNSFIVTSEKGDES